jgi:MFS family permease
MAVVYLLTRQRVVPDLAARAPERPQAARETALVLGYAALGQVGGWLVGPALGYRPFSFHIAGTLVGCSVPPSVGELWTWAIYNFVVFAVVPFFWFRRRYSATQLSLRSTNRANDLLVIVVVMAIESLVELGAFPGIFQLSIHQLLTAAPLAFGVFMIGTVLPTMVLIYAILIPRYLKLTGSFASTVLLGGVTYAAMHVVEGWSVFTTPREIALSLIFVVLQYFGPGMMKTVITLRTGNAWVHAIAYHSIAPHMLVDAPLMVKVFGLR